MCTFYRGTIESILTSCITVWYGACNASCRKSLQRIVRAAEKIVGVSLPSLQDIYSTRLTRKALSIAGDPTHPTHSFFSLLPSGRRLRSLQARTSRLKDSFIHQAVRKLNSLPSLPPLPSFTPRNTELWHYAPPPQLPTPPGPPPLTNCDPHQSLCAALDWSLPHPALSVNYLFWQSDKRLFFFCTTHICTVLFYLTGLHSICHVPYATLSISFNLFFIFLQCPHLYICIVCMYIWLNCIYLYLNVYCQCLMLTVCTKGLRVTQFQFSVCMYCTCGRIDNKADLTWLDPCCLCTFSYPNSSFQSTLHLICFDTALCKQPPFSNDPLWHTLFVEGVNVHLLDHCQVSSLLHYCGFKEQEIPGIYTVGMVINWNSNVNILIFWDTDFWLSWAVSSNHQN